MKDIFISIYNYVYSKHIYWMEEYDVEFDEDMSAIELVIPEIDCGFNWLDVEKALEKVFKGDILSVIVRITVVHQDMIPR